MVSLSRVPFHQFAESIRRELDAMAGKETAMIDQVLEEDRPMLESTQVAMASPVYRPSRMSVLETPVLAAQGRAR
jgi:hypothetical protein